MVLEPKTRTGMPLEEFIAEFERAPFELIDGEGRALMPPVALHVYVISQLIEALIAYRIHRSTGRFFTESTFVLMDVKNWVKDSRVPDIAYYAAARWEDYVVHMPDWGSKPLVLVPDLCVEVVSKNDKFSEVQQKVDLYLDDGVQQVWVISPEDRSVLLYSAGEKAIKRLTSDDALTSPLLPEFSLPVSAIFPD
jgi:Uma2 family endonuclease